MNAQETLPGVTYDASSPVLLQVDLLYYNGLIVLLSLTNAHLDFENKLLWAQENGKGFYS